MNEMTAMPLEEITAPTLIVHGTADGDLPPLDATYAASKIPGSELYWVMQELMYLAARLVNSGRRLKIVFSRYCPGYAAFKTVYDHLAYQ